YSPCVAGSQRTFMGWAYRNSTTDQDTLWTAGSGPLFYAAAGSENVTFQTQSGSSQTWTAGWPGLGQWVHWALTYNDTTKIAELFINGISQGTKTLSLAYSSIGNFALSTNSSNAWNGYMRKVMVYERILPSSEILALSHNFKTP